MCINDLSREINFCCKCKKKKKSPKTVFKRQSHEIEEDGSEYFNNKLIRAKWQ